MDTIVALHQSWIGANAAAYVDRVTSDVTRLTSWSGGIQSGPEEVAQGLPGEWGFLELAPDGHTRSARMTIRRAEVSVEGQTAKALYWVDMASGETTSIANHVSDWAYGNRGLILQAFVKEGGCWKLSHESDSWWLAYDPVAKMPAKSGTASFLYDFTYPVNDLACAVRFYSTFLWATGGPDSDIRRIRHGRPASGPRQHRPRRIRAGPAGPPERIQHDICGRSRQNRCAP